MLLLLRWILKLFPTGFYKLTSKAPQLFNHFSTNRVSHLYPDTLRVHLHHGSSASVGHENISNKDIVLTTYETLCSDINSSKTLRKVPWFRIVLDEGKHNIL